MEKNKRNLISLLVCVSALTTSAIAIGFDASQKCNAIYDVSERTMTLSGPSGSELDNDTFDHSTNSGNSFTFKNVNKDNVISSTCWRRIYCEEYIDKTYDLEFQSVNYNNTQKSTNGIKIISLEVSGTFSGSHNKCYSHAKFFAYENNDRSKEPIVKMASKSGTGDEDFTLKFEPNSGREVSEYLNYGFILQILAKGYSLQSVHNSSVVKITSFTIKYSC